MSLLCRLTDSQIRIAEAISRFHDIGRFIRHLPVIAATLPDDHGVRHAIACVIDQLAVMETATWATAPRSMPALINR